MADTGGRPKNALMKRHDQLTRWKESDLANDSADRSSKKIRVKFNSGCVFLASCSSGDVDEVKTLIDKGADINYANVDGLTALHQAVIDEKLDMVEFLVENGANIEAQDNEGWTPLHAAASCGFTDIAKFLIDSGAKVAACNNEGELPSDLAEEDDMEEMLSKEIKKQGINVETAKNEEERIMVEDANQMINSKNYKDRRHPHSQATSLHVAASKGYIKCMSLLIQAGADVNALDVDNWTALHAASHWGHKEAAEILAEALSNMDLKNNLGQTAFDLAEDDMVGCLEELKKKQASIKKEKKPSAPRIESKAPPPLKRSEGQPGSKSSKEKASVTRISAPDRNMLLHQDMASERKQLELKIHGDKEETPTDRLNSRRTGNSAHESGEENTSDNTRGGSFTRRRMVADITLDEDVKAVPETNNSDTTLINTTTTPLGPTATTTIPTTNTNVKRSYMTPAKDDEAETVRRAKAKRERSTRRSTQGVTAEDIESAYDTLRKSDDKDTNPVRLRRQNNAAAAAADTSSSTDTTTTFVARPRISSSSSDTTNSTTITARSRYGRDEDKAKEREKEEEESPKKSLTPTTTITRRRPRERRRPTGVINLDEEEEEPAPTSRTTSSTADRYSRPLSTSSAGTTYSSDRGGSGRYDSTTKSLDTPSSRADRLSGLGTTSSYSSRDKTATVPCSNCKKLFDEKEEQLTQALDQTKDRDLEIAELKASRKSDRLETKSVDNDKRERRALERRVSELEEELKKMEKLKADNQRLKDENGALVRVISKLSK